MKSAPFLTVPLLALLGLLAGCAQESEIERVRERVAEMLPDVAPENVRPSAAPGLYEVRQGSLFAYLTADGKYLIQGDMLNLETGEQVTEGQRKAERVASVAALGTENTIEFGPAEPKDAKYAVTVFTDVDCGYCRKLHREIDAYIAQGITIRYVFYPRAGPDSESFRKAEAIWCAEDRKAALTLAKQGAPMKGHSDCANPIQREWELGQELGLRGTPMMVLADGEVVNGYVPAEALAQHLAQLEEGTAVPVAARADSAAQ